MKKNWGVCRSKTTVEVFKHFLKDPLEHLSGNHQYCDKVWCLAKRAEREKIYAHEDDFLSKIKDAKIYADLFAIVSTYGTFFCPLAKPTLLFDANL